MAQIPETINHYFSKITGLRLISKHDFNFFYTHLKLYVDEVERLNKEVCRLDTATTFIYLPRNNSYQTRIRDLIKIIKPKKAKHFEKIRLGRKHDGGYVCLDDFNNLKYAVSLGIDGDVSWDLDAVARGLFVYQYDYSIDKPPVCNEKFLFQKLKVCSVNSDESITLDNIVKSNNIDVPQKSFLKMDIEGDEFDTFLSASDSTMNCFSQIVCEFHDFDKIIDEKHYQKIYNCFDKIRNNFEVIHIHGNNYSPLMLFNDGFTFPQVLEISFANKKIYEFDEIGETYPQQIDYPNHPLRNDYLIDWQNI